MSVPVGDAVAIRVTWPIARRTGQNSQQWLSGSGMQTPIHLRKWADGWSLGLEDLEKCFSVPPRYPQITASKYSQTCRYTCLIQPHPNIDRKFCNGFTTTVSTFTHQVTNNWSPTGQSRSVASSYLDVSKLNTVHLYDDNTIYSYDSIVQ